MFRKFLITLLSFGVLTPAFAIAASDSMMGNESMMSGEHMGMMMTHGLDASCSSLRKLSTDEKAKMLTDIGHNMDAGALRQVYRCLFTGAAKKRIARITDNALKLDPKKPEMVYYIPSTQQFFVTCTGMKTIAYVVQGKDVTNPKQYFEQHRAEFADSAKMAKTMFEDMMKTQMMK